MKASARCVIVALTLCSWIAISNHCAFAAVATKGEQSPSECPFHSKPAKQKENSANVRCCKVLRALVAKFAKSWARDDAKCSDVDPSATLLAVLTDPFNSAPLLLDTGPPGKTSFVELIASMRAHAPPHLV